MGKWIEQHTERRNVYKWYEVLGEILYVVSVVGNNTYSKNTKMGGEIL